MTRSSAPQPAPHSRPNPGPLRSNQGGLLALVPSTSTEGPHLALVPRAPRPSRARRCPAAFGFYYTFLLGSAAARPFLRECPRPPARQNFARSIAPPNFRAPRPRRSPAQGSLWRLTTALVPGTSTEGPHLALAPRAQRFSRARRCPAAFGFYYTFLPGSAAARPFLMECPRPPARQNFARSIAPPNFRAPPPRAEPCAGLSVALHHGSSAQCC